MKNVWLFLRQPRNLAVFVALAGGLGFLWKEIIAPKPFNPETAPAIVQQATTSSGTAVNATGQAQVMVGESPVVLPSSSLAASAPRSPVSQNAQTNSGGTAVNATDSARVQVNKNGASTK